MVPRKEIVSKFFSNGKFLTSDAIEYLEKEPSLIELALSIEKTVIKAEDIKKLKKPEERQVLIIKKEDEIPAKEYEEEIKVENLCDFSMKERKARDFNSYFVSRLQSIQEMLMKRINPISISNLRENGEEQSIVGMVYEKRVSPAGNIILVLEDFSGFVKCIVNKESEVFRDAQDVLEDEVIGVRGVFRNNFLFVNEIIHPDFPAKEKVHLDLPIDAVFISDLHVGSIDFLDDVFIKFIKWLKTSEEARRIKYIFICGDVVDGVGIYPGQEKDLRIKDIYKQYEKARDLLLEIPEHIKLIIAPGNHDIVGIPEPQPPLKNTALTELPNAILVSNPCYIRLHNRLKILMYHGYSYDGIIQGIPSLRKSGYQNPSLPMLEVLKRRHLSPRMDDTMIIPNSQDHLVIKEIPDIFHSGHLHTTSVMNYKHVTLINSGTFQAQTEYQKMQGHIPHPGIITLVNLQTREVRLINFLK